MLLQASVVTGYSGRSQEIAEPLGKYGRHLVWRSRLLTISDVTSSPEELGKTPVEMRRNKKLRLSHSSDWKRLVKWFKESKEAESLYARFLSSFSKTGSPFKRSR